MKIKLTRKENREEFEDFAGEEEYFGGFEEETEAAAEEFSGSLHTQPQTNAFANPVALKIVNPKGYSNASEIADYLLNGNIKNSVNLPNVAQEWSGICRLCLIHKNIPGMLTALTGAVAAEGLNIENMTNKSKGDNAYTMVDITGEISDDTVAKLAAIDGVFKVRVI